MSNSSKPILEQLRYFSTTLPVEVEIEYEDGRVVRAPVVKIDHVYDGYSGHGGVSKIVLRTPRFATRNEPVSTAFIKEMDNV
jgi:hypothetical protein